MHWVHRTAIKRLLQCSLAFILLWGILFLVEPRVAPLGIRADCDEEAIRVSVLHSWEFDAFAQNPPLDEAPFADTSIKVWSQTGEGNPILLMAGRTDAEGKLICPPRPAGSERIRIEASRLFHDAYMEIAWNPKLPLEKTPLAVSMGNGVVIGQWYRVSILLALVLLLLAGVYRFLAGFQLTQMDHAKGEVLEK